MESDKRVELFNQLSQMEIDNNKLSNILNDVVSIHDYEHLVSNGVWTIAIQQALNEHSVVIIPPSNNPYIIDDSIIIPSNRKIIAYGAVIKSQIGMYVLMFRNEHPIDETHYPSNKHIKDQNINILGGTFEESVSSRLGYGKSGKYDKERSFYGVSCCILFNNVKHLNIKDVTFSHCGGFALQAGLVENAVFDNIVFDECYADGLHFGGNINNILIKNIKGIVGDDIVALNMYDWQDSSVNFGVGENIWCENVELFKESKYKAIRLESGIYKFDNGQKIDCALKNVMIKNTFGIRTFKLYLQTPPYTLGTSPEWADVGSMENIYFEDLNIDLFAPIDTFKEYMNGDELRGTFAAFEIGANIKNLILKNINLTLDKQEFPMGYLVCAGPKSIVRNNKEFFDPYISCQVNGITFDNIVINNEKTSNLSKFIKEISFDNVNNDRNSTGKGTISSIQII